MRTIIISDIHGYHRTFLSLLEMSGYNPDSDRLRLLGDYVDGGPASLAVIRTAQLLVRHSNAEAIGGNHDDMFLRWLDDQDYVRMPYPRAKNGGLQTIVSFCPSFEEGVNDDETRCYIRKHFAAEVQFLRELPNYIEDDDYIYVHAGINPTLADWKQTSHKDFRWLRGRFHNHAGCWTTHKTIIFGHEVTARLHKDDTIFQPWYGNQMIGIDGGIKFGFYLNALIIEEDGGHRVLSLKSCD